VRVSGRSRRASIYLSPARALLLSRRSRRGARTTRDRHPRPLARERQETKTRQLTSATHIAHPSHPRPPALPLCTLRTPTKEALRHLQGVHDEPEDVVEERGADRRWEVCVSTGMSMSMRRVQSNGQDVGFTVEWVGRESTSTRRVERKHRHKAGMYTTKGKERRRGGTGNGARRALSLTNKPPHDAPPRQHRDPPHRRDGRERDPHKEREAPELRGVCVSVGSLSSDIKKRGQSLGMKKEGSR
jgi:hypothetical protein